MVDTRLIHPLAKMKTGVLILNKNMKKKEQPRINNSEDGDYLSLLPNDLIDSVTQLLNLEQLIRFSIVSRSWNKLSPLPLHGNPWLILPSVQSTSKFDCTCDATIGFFNPSSGKVYEIPLPQIKERRICGSCPGGWLITVHDQGEIQILHPFSKAVFSLPPISELHGIVGHLGQFRNKDKFETVAYVAMLSNVGREAPVDMIRDAYIYKAVMSSDNPKTSVVMSIQGFPKKLVFCRMKENERWFKRSLWNKRWILVNGHQNVGLSDVTFYSGLFYTIRNSGDVYVVEGLDTPWPFFKFVIDRAPYPMAFTKYYLVEFLGELLCVMRFRFKSPQELESPVPLTTYFKVSKLDLNGVGPKWIDVHNLGEDHALFIGFNQSFSFTTSDCQGFKGNSIYFGDDDYMENHNGEPFGGHDIGVFSLTGNIVEKYCPNVATPIMPPPIWFTTHAGYESQLKINHDIEDLIATNITPSLRQDWYSE